MPTNLQTLLDAIPEAIEGRVIGTEYHNSVKAALIELSDRLNVTADTTMVTVPTVWSPAGNHGRWWPDFEPGEFYRWQYGMIARIDPVRSNAVGGTAYNMAWGISDVQLPHGALITGLSVIGLSFPNVTNEEEMGTGYIKLERRPAVSSTAYPIELPTPAPPSLPLESQRLLFNAPFPAVGATPGAFSAVGTKPASPVADLYTVDNTRFKYHFEGQLYAIRNHADGGGVDGLGVEGTFGINAILITYRKQ